MYIKNIIEKHTVKEQLSIKMITICNPIIKCHLSIFYYTIYASTYSYPIYTLFL